LLVRQNDILKKSEIIRERQMKFDLNPALQKMKKITFFLSRYYVKNKKESSFTDEVK